MLSHTASLYLARLLPPVSSLCNCVNSTIAYNLDVVINFTYSCFKVHSFYDGLVLKKRTVEGKAVATKIQAALKNTLDLFDGESKDLLLFYLYREHGISVYEPENLSRKKIESAFEAVFGMGAGILIEK